MDQKKTEYAALQERVKELTCLYSLAQLATRSGAALEETLHGSVRLLPPAWQYPEITAGRIVLDDRSYVTANFREGVHRQSSDIVVNGERRGAVDVVYLEERPECDEGPFLKEERHLIAAVAQQIALIVERRQAQEQLRRADRLATIGQLAAGVAHELNEPLGNILGFAQLAQKHPDLPKQVFQDIEKIVTASLHGREVIKKLMLFARKTPPRKKQVHLNAVVEQSLHLLESRCVKNGVNLIRRLSPEIPQITADPSQLQQVLVNLVVNAIQAMPSGGVLTITTCVSDSYVVLVVEDSGIGMSKQALKQIFAPFFTTKDVNEGTGLGLPVVHGIITSHRGTIRVESTPGRGTRFEVRLPIIAAEECEEERRND